MNDEGQVILRFRDGRTERAKVAQIDAPRELLNITRSDDGAVQQIPYSDLKAVFFPQTVPEEMLEPVGGSLIAVEFDDGEVIRGKATFDPAATGFFLFPLDRSKNDRIFVVRSAIVSIEVEKL